MWSGAPGAGEGNWDFDKKGAPKQASPQHMGHTRRACDLGSFGNLPKGCFMKMGCCWNDLLQVRGETEPCAQYRIQYHPIEFFFENLLVFCANAQTDHTDDGCSYANPCERKPMKTLILQKCTPSWLEFGVTVSLSRNEAQCIGVEWMGALTWKKKRHSGESATPCHAFFDPLRHPLHCCFRNSRC